MADIRTELEEMNRLITGMQGYWDGEAAQVHQAVYDDTKEIIEEYVACLPEKSQDKVIDDEVFGSDLID